MSEGVGRSVRPHRARLSALALDRVYTAHKDLPQVREIHGHYIGALIELLRVARRFETLQEIKWSRSIEAAVTRVEHLARLHIVDIAERAGRQVRRP